VLLPPGACQFETWLQTSAQQPAQWLLVPACNLGGAIEWSVGLGLQKTADGGRQDQFGLQAKTLFKELVTGSWGWGASLGLSRPLPGSAGRTLAAGTVMLSLAPSAPLALHLNAGATRGAGQTARANWGAAFEYTLDERWTLVGERYGERHGRPFTALGVAFWLRPDKLQLDATLGREPRPGGHARCGTLGLAWLWNDALPAR